jgi:hypothetical protein
MTIGKTLTAEAVAEYLHRPLYAISSTQLSTSVGRLESNLKSILKVRILNRFVGSPDSYFSKAR